MRGIHWFRNDLRLHDNLGIFALAEHVEEWLPIFVVDSDLEQRTASAAPRVRFLFDCLRQLDKDLSRRGIELRILRGQPEALIPEWMAKTNAALVTWCNASTPWGQRRDARVAQAVARMGGRSMGVDDHTVFGPDEIKTRMGGNYSVYTPYRNEWWRTWDESPRWSPSGTRLPRSPIIMKGQTTEAKVDLPVDEKGTVRLPRGGEASARRRLNSFLEGPARRYHVDRDRPDLDGTSRLSPYLRFGSISIRRCFSEGLRAIEADPSKREGISKWLDELIWREFYNAVLVHSPHVLSGSFRPEYDELNWSGSIQDFEAWCTGQTGYPFVDAGMRQLRATGWMHNRVRMVVASFLSKDLRVDWRKGERFFWDSLVDGDPASNNGGWQWAASTGTDAQPYFRIFNPVSQGKKWDPDGKYVRRWIPELRSVDARWIQNPWDDPRADVDYPRPIVDHSVQRTRTLDDFARVRATRR